MTAADPVAERPALIERLPFVEGVRGLAALIVVVYHAIYPSVVFPGTLLHADLGQALAYPFWPATEMVELFILVSGFSLAYSEDRRRQTRPPTAARVFALRRAWRILPVFYVALAAGLVVLAIAPTRYLDGVRILQPQNITAGGLLSHTVLLHSLVPEWQYQGNGPLWSMGVEAQLYLLFPLLFLWMRRGRTVWTALAVALAAAVADLARRQLLPDFQGFGYLRWFALGVLIATIYRDPRVRRVPARAYAAVGLAALLVAYLNLPALAGSVPHDALWALAFAGLLIAMAQRPRARANPMGWRPLRWLGMRSYSLYALHFPMIWIVFIGLAAAGVHGSVSVPVLTLCLGLALSLAAAELSYRWVERPSLARVRAVR